MLLSGGGDQIRVHDSECVNPECFAWCSARRPRAPLTASVGCRPAPGVSRRRRATTHRADDSVNDGSVNNDATLRGYLLSMTSDAKVSVLSLHYPPEPTGNAPYAGSLAEGLASLGADVAAEVGHPHYPEWRIRSGYGQWTSHEHIRGVSVTRRRHYVPNPPRGWRRLLSELSFGFRLLAAPIAPDSVVIALSPSMFATSVAALRIRLARRKRKLIIWVQDIYTLGLTETGEGRGPAGRIVKFIESRALKSADFVVVIHPRFASYVVDHLDVKQEKVRVIRNWTHLNSQPSIPKSEARTMLGWDPTKHIVLHAGNMGAKQGLENVVGAARLADSRNANIDFVLLGDGGERARLERLAEGIQRISFINPMDDERFRLALAAADILLVNERVGVSEMAVPSKLTSYFDAARPVVAATDPEGITASEIALSGGGTVVAAGDPGALLDEVCDLIADETRLRELGEKGRQFRERALDRCEALAAWSELLEEPAQERTSR